MTLFSFINDDRGVLEPHNDILATALMIIGFVVLAAILAQTYLTYDDNSMVLRNYEEATRIAENIASFDEIQAAGPDRISAQALDTISYPISDSEAHRRFFARYADGLDLSVHITTDDGHHQWTIERYSTHTLGNNVIAASVPVVIELSPAEFASGTIRVSIQK
ncbi:MAG: hypothetical protein K8R64_04095 [Methanosarcinaceae archaeon]|nr:hypothetical protein [Methanosarcinaceae archaeon]